MKKTIFAVVMAAASLGVNAADNYLHIRTANGWEVYDLNTVDRLTFKGGVMTATDASDNVVATIQQSDLQMMYVNETSGVGSVTAASAAGTFVFDCNSRAARMLTDGTFEVYAADGALLVSIPGVRKGECVSLAGLSEGIVILKSGDYSIKAVIK